MLSAKVLEDLREKADQQLSALRKAETNTKHSYDNLKKSLDATENPDAEDASGVNHPRSAAKHNYHMPKRSLDATKNSDGNLTSRAADFYNHPKMPVA